jgi:hypothetical protein
VRAPDAERGPGEGLVPRALHPYPDDADRSVWGTPVGLITDPEPHQMHRGDRRGTPPAPLEVAGQVDIYGRTVREPLAVGTFDPDTSEAAARRSRTVGKRSRLRADILRLHQLHPAGLTDDALAETLVGDDRGTIARRRLDLVREGLLEDSGDRRVTRRGSQAVVWKLAR